MALSHQARLNGVVLLKIDGAVHEILMKNMWPLGHMWPSLINVTNCDIQINLTEIQLYASSKTYLNRP